VVCAALTIAAGLGSRRLGASLPRFVAEYAGDTLYATLMVLLVAFARPRASAWAPVVVGLGLSALVEVSQLVQGGPLGLLRATTLGRLVLGTTFVWSDFPCYAAGALLGGAIDRLVWLTGARGGPDARPPPPPP